MTPKERAAMQQALEALEEYRDTQMIKAPRRAITALRETLAEQAEQEPVAKTALKNCIYFDSIDFSQTPPYLRYDTGDSTPQENWTVYCDIQDDLREDGYELTDSGVDHDTVWGYVTPIAAPVRTKDLTDDEVMQTYTNFNLNELGEQSFMIGFARAVIQEFRRKNGIV